MATLQIKLPINYQKQPGNITPHFPKPKFPKKNPSPQPGNPAPALPSPQNTQHILVACYQAPLFIPRKSQGYQTPHTTTPRKKKGKQQLCARPDGSVAVRGSSGWLAIGRGGKRRRPSPTVPPPFPYRSTMVLPLLPPFFAENWVNRSHRLNAGYFTSSVSSRAPCE